MTRNPIAIFGWILLFAAPLSAAPVKEKLPPGTQIVAIEARPSGVELKNNYDYAQLIVTARTAAGEQVDVTRMAAIVAGELADVSPSGLVRPKADGAGELKISLGDKSLAVPLKVSGQQADFQVSFVRDVMPVLSKMGCNAGTCHGSKDGKNGFKLSLRGYDPLYDHRSLTDDIAGRRFNRAAPDQSMMLLKPAGVIPHVGGVIMQPGQPYYDLIRAWIAGGVKLDLNAPRVTKIEILPQNPIVPLTEMSQQMTVQATYSDGTVRDVTLEAFIESGNTDVAAHNKTGLVTTVRRGEAPVLARFEGSYTATIVTVMGDRSGYEWKQPPVNNYIDELVNQKLQRVKSIPSELCTDAEFIRRVSLDLTGLPPTPEEVKAFLADPRATHVKRDELIDRLIGGGDYIEHWSNKWADLLQVNRKFLGEQGVFALRGWIKQAVASNMPYDQFVYSILTASGSSLENPPAAYYKVLRTPEETMENTTQLFLAVRFNCNKCHDHPFERWTQGQYYHLAAYFAQVGRKEDQSAAGQKIGGTAVEGAVALVEDIFDTGTGEVIHLGTGKAAQPTFPYEHSDTAPESAARREQLARWITSKENQYFAKSYVNRLWGYLFGIGIIEPIDDIRAGNPATNPELLERLTREFVTSGFNTQEMLRAICKSRTYQLALATNKWNEGDDLNYSHAIARRLPAEALYDSIQRATGSVSKLPGVPAGYRAAQLPDVGLTLPSGFFEMFGRPPRESACECERTSGMMLGPIMALVNGPTIADAIADPYNAITKLVATERDDKRLVEELFLRILCRPPTSNEIETGLKALQTAGDEQHKLAEELAAHEKTLDARQAEWEASLGPVEWTILEPAEMKSTANATFAKQPDNSVLVGGPTGKDTYTIVASTTLEGVTGIRLEALADPRLPSQGPGRSKNGNFVVSEFRVTAAPKNDSMKVAPVLLQNATADFSQDQYPVKNAIDNNPDNGWAVSPQNGKDHVAVFETVEDLKHPGGTILTFNCEQRFNEGSHSIGRFRLSVTTARRPLSSQGPPPAVAKILAIPTAQRSPEQRTELSKYFRSLDASWVKLSQAVAAAQSGNQRLLGAQDLAWALINSPAFLFNR